jgi:uncharacterized membrane protein YfcA
MSTLVITAICATGFLASIVGAIGGGNSLITVPVMIFLGMSAKSAVATNMIGVLALSIGASARFAVSGDIPRKPTLGLVLLAIPGSALGALIATQVPESALRLIVAIATVGAAIFLISQPSFGASTGTPTKHRQRIGWAIAAVWAIYGGLYSGGYVTLLTIGATYFFGTRLIESVALVKVVNIASSAAAVLVFLSQNLIRLDIALPFSLTLLVGGSVGAHLATRISHKWVRGITVGVVLCLALALAIKTLVALL